MKLLYLMYKSCSRLFIRELFLVIQMAVVIVLLNTAITPFVNYYQIEGSINKGVPENVVYYSVPTFSGDSNEKINYFEKFENDKDVKAICLTYKTYGEINGLPADILLYNEDVFSCLSSSLQSGKWEYNTSCIYVNEQLAEYTNDDSAEVVFAESGISEPVRLTVSGVTNPRDIVYDFGAAGSQPELTRLASDFQYIRDTSVQHTPFLALIPFDFDASPYVSLSAQGAILVLADDITPDDIMDKYADIDLNGSLYRKSTLTGNSLNRLISTYKFDAMLAVLLMISTIFGIGGYTYLKAKSLQKQMGVYKLLGCRNNTFCKIVLFTNAVLVVLASGIALAVQQFVVLGEGNSQMASGIIAIAFMVIISIVPTILTLYSSSKLAFTELIYYGD